jgi:methylglutaconyl-CoA hydratase
VRLSSDGLYMGVMGSAPSHKTLQIAVYDMVATVSLNRPEVHNAFNAQLIGELTETFQALARDASVRVIVLRGEGKSFCAGADVNWMRESLDLSGEENIADALRMSDMFAAIDEAPQAVIGRVHGAALGGAMGLLAVCDIVVAADDTRFGFTEARLGIIPAVISRFVVPKIGPSWARRLFVTGEGFGSDRAREIGLVHDVAAGGDLDETIAEVCTAALNSGPNAIRESKALIAGLEARAPAEWRELTAQRIAAVRTSPEGQEGLRAFLEKRNPAW